MWLLDSCSISDALRHQNHKPLIQNNLPGLLNPGSPPSPGTTLAATLTGQPKAEVVEIGPAG